MNNHSWWGEAAGEPGQTERRAARREPRATGPRFTVRESVAKPVAEVEAPARSETRGAGRACQALLARRRRRSDGEPLPNMLGALLVWPLLQAKSLHCFCAGLCQFLAGQVSVRYDFLGREAIHWRGVSSALAWRVHQGNELGPRSQRAFVVDDTSQARAGRQVQGTSCYFDHTQARCLCGRAGCGSAAGISTGWNGQTFPAATCFSHFSRDGGFTLACCCGRWPPARTSPGVC